MPQRTRRVEPQICSSSSSISTSGGGRRLNLAKLETPGARTRDSHSLAHNIKHIKCGPQHEIYKTKCNINIVTQSKDTKINAKYKLLVRVSGNVFEKRI
jgi:hypothetical protein